MATNSTRNVTMEQHQAMWPDASFTQDVYNYITSSSKYEDTMPGSVTYICSPPTAQKKLADMAKEAVKADSGKPDWSLVPFEALEEIVKVLEFGKNKYGAYNFASGEGLKYTRLLSAAMRHLFAFTRGEDKDPESGLSHIAHLGCNVIFLLYFIKNKSKYPSVDNRY
jgi:Domain of unknown function (DUF5664)